MQQTQLRPMSIGKILDRSFQLYRKHFVKLTLMMLLLFGPFYFIQNVLLFNQTTSTTNSIIDEIKHSYSFGDVLNSGGDFSSTSPAGIWQMVIFIVILLPIYVLGLAPVASAATLFLVKAAVLGEETPTLGSLLKRAFRRFWPMTGSTFVMSLILGGIYLVFAIVMMILGAIFVFGSGISGAIGGASLGFSTGVFWVIFIILLIVGFLGGWAYFFIRWSYFLPFVAMKEDSLGIGRSWNLTKLSFWRLFLMYIVLVIVLYVFVLVINLIIVALAGQGLFSQLLRSLISVLISPLWILPYAVSFFDLKVRNEGMGLDDLLRNALADDGEPDKKNE